MIFSVINVICIYFMVSSRILPRVPITHRLEFCLQKKSESEYLLSEVLWKVLWLSNNIWSGMGRSHTTYFLVLICKLVCFDFSCRNYWQVSVFTCRKESFFSCRTDAVIKRYVKSTSKSQGILLRCFYTHMCVGVYIYIHMHMYIWFQKLIAL